MKHLSSLELFLPIHIAVKREKDKMIRPCAVPFTFLPWRHGAWRAWGAWGAWVPFSMEPKMAMRPAPQTQERARDTCSENRRNWSPGNGDTGPDRMLMSQKGKVQRSSEERLQPHAGTQAGLRNSWWWEAGREGTSQASKGVGWPQLWSTEAVWIESFIHSSIQ